MIEEKKKTQEKKKKPQPIVGDDEYDKNDPVNE